MDIINIQKAGFYYPSHIPEIPSIKAVSNISMCIEQGSYWVILGRNGSGKSTLSRLMNALLIPAEGVVIIDGLETSNEEHLWQVRRTVGVVFQNPDNQIVATTVEEDVAFGPENLGFPQAEIRKRVDDSLKIVDMEEYVKHSPHMLSGGQKQRVAVAGVLAMEPKCIVLDEATSMLDPQGRKEVLKAIRTLHKDYGLTVVLITHHMDEAIEADQIFVMQEGEKLFSGSPKEVFQQTTLLRDAGLDVPQLTSFGENLVNRKLYTGALPVLYSEAQKMMETFENRFRQNDQFQENDQDYESDQDKRSEQVQENDQDYESDQDKRSEQVQENNQVFESDQDKRSEQVQENNQVYESDQDQRSEQLQRSEQIQKNVIDKNKIQIIQGHPIIRINNLRHVYMPATQYERVALDGVTLDIYQGEILGIIGHTGSGKSTFVQHLNGLLKATSGTLEVEGTLVQPKTLKALRKKVGLIFQYPEHQLFEETVYKDIAFGLVQNGASVVEIDFKVHKVADLLSITEDMLQKSPFELSGGQKRRVAIAGVLAMEPSILILDEPTAGLDPKGSMKVLHLLKELNKKEGTTILFISHHMEYIAALSDRIAVFKEGRLAMVDEPHEIFSKVEELEKMHLDIPSITRLFLDSQRRIQIKMPIVLSVEEATKYIESQLKVVQYDR